MTLSTPSILLDQVSLTRGSRLVLSNVSLDLKERRIGLIGDNGAGKSSLFRLICGLDQPSQGQLQIPTSNDLRPRVGLMFQNADEQIIFPTVEEELALSLHHLKLPRREALSRVNQWLQARGMADWGPRAVGTLSQGQRQHVCWLALNLAQHPILLLDEPFASLDLPSQARLSQEITKASQQIMVSTHQLEHVRHFERVIWLDQGQVRADGLGHDVCQAYERDVQQRIQSQAHS